MKPFYVLSLDGGGVKGVATASFLYHLEAHMKTINPEFSIHEHFDMFAGTSIGGLISMLLALKKKSAKDIYEIFSKETCDTIMDKSTWDKIMGLVQPSPKYDGKGKRKIIERHVDDMRFNDTNGKHLIVPTYNITQRKTVIFDANTCSDYLKAADVADATSAGPAYFPSVYVPHCYVDKKEGDWFIDGGVVANNPTMCALAYTYKIFPEKRQRIIIVNVGTGYKNRSIDGEKAEHFGGVEWLLNDIIGIAMDETLVHQQAEMILSDKNYINVNSELIEASDDTDDCSEDNLRKLQELGLMWWNRHKDKIVEMLTQ